MNIIEHQAQLEWFRERTGQVVPWPDKENEGMLLATKAKGIYKPAGSNLPVSIRISQDGPYADKPEFFPDGSWVIRYHEERAAGQAEPAGNTALRNAMDLAHPVGVILQVSQTPRRYKILGLGLVTDYAYGLFIVEGPAQSVLTPAPVEPEASSEAAHTADMRQRILAEVVRRQGQGKFRQTLMEAYAGRCAMTGCDAPEVLEAAHILPYRGPHSNSVRNGLLLRADLHTLFDLGLAHICPETWTVQITPEVAGAYGSFQGQPANLPSNQAHWPDPDNLKQRAAILQSLRAQSI